MKFNFLFHYFFLMFFIISLYSKRIWWTEQLRRNIFSAIISCRWLKLIELTMAMVMMMFMSKQYYGVTNCQFHWGLLFSPTFFHSFMVINNKIYFLLFSSLLSSALFCINNFHMKPIHIQSYTHCTLLFAVKALLE